jgi:hypothetical protein
MYGGAGGIELLSLLLAFSLMIFCLPYAIVVLILLHLKLRALHRFIVAMITAFCLSISMWLFNSDGNAQLSFYMALCTSPGFPIVYLGMKKYFIALKFLK